MGLNDRLRETFQVTVDKSKQEILLSVEAGKKKYTWTELLFATTIDYDEIKINDGRIEILRRARTMAPFRSFGKITIDIKELDAKSVLTCQILPLNNIAHIVWTLVCVGLILWTIAALVISTNATVLEMIVVTWASIGVFMFSHFRYSKWSLKQYSKRVIKELTQI